MLLRFAKLAGGLRLLISTAAPLVVTSVSLLSVRIAAYLVGFGLGSILSIWLPVVLTLVSLTGSFGGSTDTTICDAYRAELAAIEARNAVLIEAYNLQHEAWHIQSTRYSENYWQSNANSCDHLIDDTDYGAWRWYDCFRDLIYNHDHGAPQPPIMPQFETLGVCGSESPPDCPPGKKVWLQVLWASPGGNASDAKGCFLIGYSQDSRDLPANIEYNPYKLPDTFVKQQALNYDSIAGNKFSGVDSTKWQDLDSTIGWDKGYWAAEGVDVECRGWRPGWSLKIK